MYVVKSNMSSTIDLSLTNLYSDEFPAVCGTCIGSDKHVKMMKQVNGAECKLCTRPFTVFMWKPSIQVKKHTKTIICLTCAKARNCCQSCMLDITYGIPLDVRDAALKMAGISGISSGGDPLLTTKNREVKAIMADKLEDKFKQGNGYEEDNNGEKARDILSKLASKLNETNPKFISKSISANSKKGLVDIKNVDISKVISKLPFGGVITPAPTDDTITSFFIFGLTDELPQYLITEYFNKFGKVKNMTILHQAKCGYITFINRLSAEAFAQEVSENGHNMNKSTPGIFILDGKYPLRASWGRQKPLGETKQEHNKLSLVVNKVLRQLAEKDKNYEKLQKQNTATKKESRGKQTQPQPKQKKKEVNSGYKSLGADFEL